MWLNKLSYNARVDNIHSKYWTEGRKYRWQYMEYVITQCQIIGAKTTIEAGTMGIPLNSDSFLLDLNPVHLVNRRGRVVYGKEWDLNRFPWPVPSMMDCFIALQVWEHLDAQALAFREVARVASHAVLSFPYKWTWGDKRHKGITKKHIEKWTCGLEPETVKIINHRWIGMWRF